MHFYGGQILPSSNFVADPSSEDDAPSQQLLSETAALRNFSSENEEPSTSSWPLDVEISRISRINEEEP